MITTTIIVVALVLMIVIGIGIWFFIMLNRDTVLVTITVVGGEAKVVAVNTLPLNGNGPHYIATSKIKYVDPYPWRVDVETLTEQYFGEFLFENDGSLVIDLESKTLSDSSGVRANLQRL